RIAPAVPGAFRIHDGNRPSFANPQAVGFGSENPALVGQAELFEPPLQIVPRRDPALLVAALRRRLIGAEKNMAPGLRDADLRRDLPFAVPLAHQCASVPFCAEPKSIDIMKRPERVRPYGIQGPAAARV